MPLRHSLRVHQQLPVTRLATLRLHHPSRQQTNSVTQPSTAQWPSGQSQARLPRRGAWKTRLTSCSPLSWDCRLPFPNAALSALATAKPLARETLQPVQHAGPWVKGYRDSAMRRSSLRVSSARFGQASISLARRLSHDDSNTALPGRSASDLAPANSVEFSKCF